MTILDVIKYEVTDVANADQLKLLPEDIVIKWRHRLAKHIIAQISSILNPQLSEKAQALIDAIKAYELGKINDCAVQTIVNQNFGSDCMASAYKYAFYVNYSAALNNIAYYAAQSVYYISLLLNDDCNAALYHSDGLLEQSLQWLQEELLNYY